MNESSDGSPSAARGAQSGTGNNVLNLLSGLLGFGRRGSDGRAVPDGMLTGVGIGKMSSLRVQDVAVPKADIVAVPVDTSRVDLVGVFRKSGYSRLPVYRETLDNPLGMIHLKDLALAYGFNGKSGRFGLRKLIRPLLFAPPSMPVSLLFQKMQSERRHMALVIDEYGGVDGLVTTEDLVELVVGEIVDEHDAEANPPCVEEAPGIFLCLARMSLEAFQDTMGEVFLDGDSDEDIDTLGGLVFMACGRVPVRGEVIPLGRGYEVEIVEADPRRIRRLRVRRTGSQA